MPAEPLPPPEIHNRGRGPEIKGTRITVYDVMDYYGKPAWPLERIAELFRLTVPHVEAAVQYIEEHEAELRPQYEKMLAREAAGNPPHIRALLDEIHERFLARLNDEQRKRVKELFDGNGAPGGR